MKASNPVAASAAARENPAVGVDDKDVLMERDFMVFSGLFFIFGILCGLSPMIGNVNIILRFEECTRKIFRKFHVAELLPERQCLNGFGTGDVRSAVPRSVLPKREDISSIRRATPNDSETLNSKSDRLLGREKP